MGGSHAGPGMQDRTARLSARARLQTTLVQRMPGAAAWRRWIVGAAVAASAAAALMAALSPRGAAPAPARSVDAAEIGGLATGTAAASIVVLPLTAAGAVEPAFVDGMTTAINAELASFRSLKVIAPASARRVRERGDRDSAKIGQALGVGWILDGTVERAPSRVRLALRLNTAGSGDAVWTARFDRPIEQILELQAEVGRAVAGKMLPPDVVAREAARARRVGPVDEGVYETYLRGEFHEDQLNPASLSRAVELFTQAVTEDPGFAPRVGRPGACQPAPGVLGRCGAGGSGRGRPQGHAQGAGARSAPGRRP